MTYVEARNLRVGQSIIDINFGDEVWVRSVRDNTLEQIVSVEVEDVNGNFDYFTHDTNRYRVR